MTITGPQIRVDGQWLTSLTSWADLAIEHRWPYGCWEASWTVPVMAYQRLRQLEAGKPVAIYYGATPIWSGYMSEPDWSSGAMVAFGHVRRGDTALALDGFAGTTAIPDTAIDNAISRGAVSWTRPASFSATAYVDPAQTSAPIKLTPLLDAYAQSVGKGWAVDARGRAYLAADPTTPLWSVTPDSGVLGVADGVQAATVVGRYLTGGGGYANAVVGTGSPEVGVDLSILGAIDSFRATAEIVSIRNQLQSRRAWTNGLTLTATQISNPGGAGVNLASVVAGQMMRLLGLRDERGMSAATDIVLGSTVWDVADGTIECNPVGLVDRDLTSVLAGTGYEPLAALEAL